MPSSFTIAWARELGDCDPRLLQTAGHYFLDHLWWTIRRGDEWVLRWMSTADEGEIHTTSELPTTVSPRTLILRAQKEEEKALEPALSPTEEQYLGD